MVQEAKLSIADRFSRDAQGFDVTMRVIYRRTRKVRALSPEQAAEFAAQREADYARRFFNSSSHIFYEVGDVEVESVQPSSRRSSSLSVQQDLGEEDSEADD